MELLVVEDNTIIAKGLAYLLEKEGYTVCTAGTVEEAITLYRKAEIIILDVTLPDGNGFDFFEAYLKDTETPVLFLTARDDEEDIVRGLQGGAADYMTKPFFKRELLLRIEKIAEERKKTNTARAGAVTYDFAKKQAYEKGSSVELTFVETGLLEVLFRHQGQVLTKDILAEYVFDMTGNFVTDNAITVYINRIRRKFSENLIETKKGLGYVIQEKTEK